MITLTFLKSKILFSIFDLAIIAFWGFIVVNYFGKIHFYNDLLIAVTLCIVTYFIFKAVINRNFSFSIFEQEVNPPKKYKWLIRLIMCLTTFYAGTIALLHGGWILGWVGKGGQEERAVGLQRFSSYGFISASSSQASTA